MGEPEQSSAEASVSASLIRLGSEEWQISALFPWVSANLMTNSPPAAHHAASLRYSPRFANISIRLSHIIVKPTPNQTCGSGEVAFPSDASDWVKALRRAGLVQSATPRLEALTGGVSSEIILVEDGGQRFVVKRALAKLRVRDDWFADTGRSGVEQSYLRVVGALLPSCVPRVLFADPEAGWFAMEYLGGDFVNWKSQLLSGCAARRHSPRNVGRRRHRGRVRHRRQFLPIAARAVSRNGGASRAGSRRALA
jgi:hypothetical protein